MRLFCVIKQYYLGNYDRMAVNYHRKNFVTLAHGGKQKYLSILTLEKVGLKLPW